MNKLPWTTEEENLLKTLVNGNCSYREIQEKYFPYRSINSVKIHGYRELNLKNAEFCNIAGLKYSFDENFWETPNLLNSYWAGFIAADGCIRKKNENSYCFEMMLANKDMEHLRKFKEDVKYTGLFENVQGDKSRVRIHCREKWFNDLYNNFSIEPNKTYRLRPPNNLSEELLYSYLVGYTDGDGSIHKQKRAENICISYCSASDDIIYWVKKMTDRFVGVKPWLRNVHKYGGKNCYRFDISGQSAIRLFLFLYKFDVPKLDRKWNNPKVWELINRKHPDILKEFNY